VKTKNFQTQYCRGGFQTTTRKPKQYVGQDGTRDYNSSKKRCWENREVLDLEAKKKSLRWKQSKVKKK